MNTVVRDVQKERFAASRFVFDKAYRISRQSIRQILARERAIIAGQIIGPAKTTIAVGVPTAWCPLWTAAVVFVKPVPQR